MHLMRASFLLLCLFVTLAAAHGGNNRGDNDDDCGSRAKSKCRNLPVNTAISCRKNEDCDCVTERSGYAVCRLGKCFCNPKQGFAGNATVANKCRCPDPKSVTYVGERKGQAPLPYCINPVAAANYDFEAQRCDRLKAKVTKLYALTVWPNPIAVLSGQIKLDDVFHVDAQARITPLGVYKGIVGVEEYFYGLPGSPQSNIRSIDIPWLVCDGLKVSVLVNFLFNTSGGIPAWSWNLTEHGLFTFNEAELIVNTEGVITNLGAVINARDTEVAPGVVVPKAMIYEQGIQGICAMMTVGVQLPDGTAVPPTCTGANKNYDSYDDCVQFMHSIPEGSWDRANSNTYTCRQLHTLLTPWRPEVHCAHAGKTGGDKCLDFSYQSYYTDFGVFVGNPHNL